MKRDQRSSLGGAWSPALYASAYHERDGHVTQGTMVSLCPLLSLREHLNLVLLG